MHRQAARDWVVLGDYTGMPLLLFTLFTDFAESITFAREAMEREGYSEEGGNAGPKASDLHRKDGLEILSLLNASRFFCANQSPAI